MSARTSTIALIRTVRLLIGADDISIIHERPWHSLTFSGTQLCLCAQFSAIIAADEAERISTELLAHEFILPSQIVADIAVTQAMVTKGAQCLVIDALLLDD